MTPLGEQLMSVPVAVLGMLQRPTSPARQPPASGIPPRKAQAEPEVLK